MDVPTPIPFRSPRESLGGYILLPRLIDKVRLLAKGQLSQTYAANALKAGLTLDGRFLTFPGLNAEAVRRVILSRRTDDEVLAWVQEHARPTTAVESARGSNRSITIGLMRHSWSIGRASTRNSRHESMSAPSAHWT